MRFFLSFLLFLTLAVGNSQAKEFIYTSKNLSVKVKLDSTRKVFSDYFSNDYKNDLDLYTDFSQKVLSEMGSSFGNEQLVIHVKDGESSSAKYEGLYKFETKIHYEVSKKEKLARFRKVLKHEMGHHLQYLLISKWIKNFDEVKSAVAIVYGKNQSMRTHEDFSKFQESMDLLKIFYLVYSPFFEFSADLLALILFKDPNVIEGHANRNFSLLDDNYLSHDETQEHLMLNPLRAEIWKFYKDNLNNSEYLLRNFIDIHKEGFSYINYHFGARYDQFLTAKNPEIFKKMNPTEYNKHFIDFLNQ